jgi:hypothetical protein
LYKSILSMKSSRKAQQKELDASTAAAIWLCDCLEKVFVRMFADSDHMTTAAAHPAADQKSRSSHFHLDGYYAPVDGETIPTSNLPVSGSIPVRTYIYTQPSRLQIQQCACACVYLYILLAEKSWFCSSEMS